ncbi:MAG: alpha/beta hydrolase, partial [Planctomycetota bacterium]
NKFFLETHDAMCRRIASAVCGNVIAVEYGLAPENAFPGPIDDCHTASTWVMDHAGDLGIDPEKIYLGGDSAGGYLAIMTSIRMRDAAGKIPAGQILLYPIADYDFGTPSYQLFSTGFGLTRSSMMWFWDCYLNGGHAAPACSPLRLGSLEGLPDTFILTAGYDVLRDEGIELAIRLMRDHNHVTHLHHPGMLHGYVHFAGRFDSAQETINEIAAWICK